MLRLTELTRLPSLSIVICTLNRSYFLRFVLQAIVQCKPSFQELIVVMGPCGDETAQILNAYSNEIDCMITTSQANVSIARNLGLREATKEIVLYLDDDVIPSIPWIMSHRRVHKERGLPYAVVAGAVADCSQSELAPLQFALGVQDQWSTTYPILSQQQQQHHLQHPRWFPAVMGANVSYRRAAMLVVGGFDEFYEYFLEETDLCLRLMAAGYRIHHCDYVVKHYVQPSHNRCDRGYLTCWYTLAKNTTYFALKHRVDSVPRWLFWWRLGGLLNRRCFLRIVYLMVEQGWSLRLFLRYFRNMIAGIHMGWSARKRST